MDTMQLHRESSPGHMNQALSQKKTSNYGTKLAQDYFKTPTLKMTGMYQPSYGTKKMSAHAQPDLVIPCTKMMFTPEEKLAEELS